MTLRLNGDTSGFTEIKAADAAGDNSIKLPAANGSANQLLQNGGTAGELQYTSAGSGLHYDASGRLLQGHSSSTSTNRSLQVSGNGIEVIENLDTNSAATILLSKSRGTKSAPVKANGGDTAGQLQFRGYNGVNYQNCAQIKGTIDTGSSSTSETNMPGALTFSTRPFGSSAVVDVVQIDNSGALNLLDGCPGIDFSGIQTPFGSTLSETLDHYEEGVFTAVLDSGTVVASNCVYSRVGNMVTCKGTLSNFSDTTSSSAVRLSGFPFPWIYNHVGGTFMAKYIAIPSTGGNWSSTFASLSTQTVLFYGVNTANYDYIKHSDLTSNSAMYFEHSYFVAT